MASDLNPLLQNTVELSHELLFEAGVDGAMIAANPAWSFSFGWDEAELQAANFYDLVHPDDLQLAREATTRAKGSDAVSAVEARCRGKDGSYRWISWKVIVRNDILRGAGQDVTAMKEAQAAGDAMRGNAKVAHDINNLMQNIVGALELVRKLIGAGRHGEIDRFITSAIASAHQAAELNQQRRVPSSAPSEAEKSTKA